MTIDALTMMVVDVLGRYVVDQGATLVKEAGQAAAQAASQLAELVLRRLKADPADARNTERFQEDPKGYRVPITDAVTEKAKSDPDFAAQLSALLREFQTAASSNTPGIKPGSGALATRGGVAGGVAVAGNVKGEITINNTRSNYTSGGTGP